MPEPFSKDPNRTIKKCYALCIKAVDKAHEVDQISLLQLEEARMHVMVCERFDEWYKTHGKDIWAAITDAVTDTLHSFPLQGYYSDQQGFGGFQ